MNITLSNLEINETAGVTGVQLVQRSGKLQLLLARGKQLSEAAVPAAGASRPLEFTPAGETYSRSSWDAKPFEGTVGELASVYVRAESAVSWAMFHTPKFAVDSRIHMETFAVYDHPRFVKGQRPDQWSVTAVKYADGLSIPMIFSRGALGGSAPRVKEAGAYPDTVLDARLLQTSDGFWLFLLMNDSGQDQNPTFREPSAGRRAPAVLKALHLNAALEITSVPTRLFGATPIYEFDVDATPGGAVAIFATTQEGAIFAKGILEPGKPMPTWNTVKLETPLVSPSVVIHGGEASIAAVADMAGPHPSVVYGAVPLQ